MFRHVFALHIVTTRVNENRNNDVLSYIGPSGKRRIRVQASSFKNKENATLSLVAHLRLNKQNSQMSKLVDRVARDTVMPVNTASGEQ